MNLLPAIVVKVASVQPEANNFLLYVELVRAQT